MILMKDIVDDTNPLIRQISQPVDLPLSQEDRKVLMDMYEYLVNSQDEKLAEKYDLRPGVGMAAIQVGVLKRMCAIHVINYDDDGDIKSEDNYALVNPKVVS
ncbi:MAG: peptide deformylase, partial [Coprobacillus sp.]